MATAWHIRGSYFESCNCDPICPCRRIDGVPGGRSTHGICTGVLSWRIEEGTALIILSEVGTDMTRWPSVQHFWSWLGLCPQHSISGGKVLSRRVRPGAHRVTVALRLAARSLHHSQSALGAFFRRMKARLGTPKAITATAHKLARLVYSLLQHGSAYVQQGLDAYEAQYHERKVKTMAKQAKALGYTLVPLAAQG